MKQWVAVLQRVFSPAVPLLIMLLLLSGISLPAVFLLDLKDTLPAYILYAVSAYTAAVLSVRLIVLVKCVRALLHKNPFLHKYLTEPGFKAEVSHYTSLGVNLFYAVYKTAAAVYYHSAWFGATAFYYLVCSTLRFLLLRSARGKRYGRAAALRQYRFCGYFLLILTISLLAMGFHAIYGGQAVRYPGYMIYAAAGYTFYNLGAALANLVRYKKQANPVYAAGKMIAFSAALVSLFFLQTAMFAAFGGGAWQNRMNLATGLVVFLLIAAISLHMILLGGRALRNLAK